MIVDEATLRLYLGIVPCMAFAIGLLLGMMLGHGRALRDRSGETARRERERIRRQARGI